MSLRNEMEQRVREELEKVAASGGQGIPGCRCDVCRTDVVALALTMLPPLYCRQGSADTIAGTIRAGTIANAVQVALKLVNLRPRHRPGELPGSRESIALVNYTLEVGSSMVGPALGRSERGCSCVDCRADTLAYALNRYPAKYGVDCGGRRSLHPTYIDFMRYELGMLISQAARIVSSQPRHAHVV